MKSSTIKDRLCFGSCKIPEQSRVRRLTQIVNQGQNGYNNLRQTSTHKLIQESGGALLLPGVYDALSGLLAFQAGHKAAFLSGYAVSAALLGEPDIGVLTPPEVGRKAGQVCYAVPSLNVFADVDTGGGNAINVQRTIKTMIRMGCKGAFIEDQQWPKRSGHLRSKEVISMDEFAVKIAAAREVIGDKDFFLVARTDARAMSAKHGLDDAITRANLYIAAGADASFVEAPRSKYEMQEIANRTEGLRVSNMIEGGITPLHSLTELKDMGFHIVLYPLTPIYAAAKALKDTYAHLAAQGTSKDLQAGMVGFNEFGEIVGLEQRIQMEEHLSKVHGEDKLHVRVKAPMKPAVWAEDQQ